jgi:hypothetical protein
VAIDFPFGLLNAVRFLFESGRVTERWNVQFRRRLARVLIEVQEQQETAEHQGRE